MCLSKESVRRAPVVEDDLAIRVSDSEPHISPVRRTRLLVLSPRLAKGLLVSLLRRV